MNPEDHWLAADWIFDGTHLHPQAAVPIQSGCVAGAIVEQAALPKSAIITQRAHIICPGLVDLQVNGGGGALFNATPTAAALTRIFAAHSAGGTRWWLPTFITDAPGTMMAAAVAVADHMGRDGVAGIHLEGPHISTARRGTHNAAFVRPFDGETGAVIGFLRERRVPVVLTLAPEAIPAGLIARLVADGVVVSIGHTAAPAERVSEALREGASMFTHLFNGMTGMTSRDPGVVGVALDSDAYCGLIADGHHVDYRMLRLALRARAKPGRMFLVSDAMATWNGPLDFDLYGERLTVQGGRIVNAAGSLAGAHIDALQSVHNAVQFIGADLEDALAMATAVPARAMNLFPQLGALREGTPIADLCCVPSSWAK